MSYFIGNNKHEDKQRGSRNREKRFKIDRLRAPWVPAPAKSSSASSIAPFDIRTQYKKIEAFSDYQGGHIPSSSSTVESIELTPPTSRQQKGLMGERMLSIARTSTRTHGQFSNDLLKANSKLSTNKIEKSLQDSNDPVLNQVQKQRNSRQRHIYRPSSQVKKVKRGHRRKGTQYTLQSKDSLIDVTACLQEKREEVMKLWQKNLVKGDPTLLSSIENANRLALEAAEEVEKLRRTIQDYQKKEDGLSDSDCVQLEKMRVHVLEKVKKFEEADNFLQESIAGQSTSKTSLQSKTSQTEINTNAPQVPEKSESATFTLHSPSLTVLQNTLANTSHSDQAALNQHSHSMIVLKEQPVNFSEESECDNDTYNVNETLKDTAISIPMQNRTQEKVPVPSAGPPIIPSLENLSRLKLLYEESLTFPSLREIINLGNLGGSGGNVVNSNIPTSTANNENFSNAKLRQQNHSTYNRVRFTERDIGIDGQSDNVVRNMNSDELYREKISALQRHLMDTEQEVEELRSEVERIESDANFRVRILQNSVQDKFESLQVIPDYLQLVDQRLNETVQDKIKLQQVIENKEVLISEIKEQNHNLKLESDQLREQLRKAENSNDFLSFKNAEMEKSNTELRKQVEELTKQVAQMTSWNAKSVTNEEPMTTQTSHSMTKLSWENETLKLQCAELKEQLSQAKKMAQSLRKSKTKLVASLNERVEELMDALQQAQHHKRILGDQIRYLKKSYHELFTPEMFAPLPSKKASCMRSKKSTKSNHKPVDEPKIQSKVSWRTGNGAATGIKLDDLLQATKKLN